MEREQWVQWIDEAVQAGARLAPACAEADISIRTHQRWTRNPDVCADARPRASRPTPSNKLSEAECALIISTANETRFASLPPSQIVPRLADEGVYLASESSFYRVLHAADQLHHRGRAAAPIKRVATTHVAHAPNEVWCWDITYLPAAIRGDFFYLYLMLGRSCASCARGIRTSKYIIYTAEKLLAGKSTQKKVVKTPARY